MASTKQPFSSLSLSLCLSSPSLPLSNDPPVNVRAAITLTHHPAHFTCHRSSVCMYAHAQDAGAPWWPGRPLCAGEIAARPSRRGEVVVAGSRYRNRVHWAGRPTVPGQWYMYSVARLGRGCATAGWTTSVGSGAGGSGCVGGTPGLPHPFGSGSMPATYALSTITRCWNGGVGAGRGGRDATLGLADQTQLLSTSTSILGPQTWLRTNARAGDLREKGQHGA